MDKWQTKVETYQYKSEEWLNARITEEGQNGWEPFDIERSPRTTESLLKDFPGVAKVWYKQKDPSPAMEF